MAGNQQRDIQQRMPDLIGIVIIADCPRSVFAEVLQLINQVKKEKQRQKTNRYKGYRGHHLAVYQASNGFHGFLPSSWRAPRP